MSNSKVKPALTKGALILVTGANGYIGSHVADQLLKLGYRVRGTVRNEKPWLNKLFSKYGEGKFESVVVSDLTKDDAFVEVVKGVDGIIHVASDATLSPDPERVISVAVKGTLNILKAAAKTPSVTRVVITSSSTACNLPKSYEPEVVITEDTWNDEATTLFDNLDSCPESAKGYIVYSVSKKLAEEAAWKFTKENKPDFALNTVLPATTFGAILDPENIWGSTGGMIRNIYAKHDFESWRHLAPQYQINVVDCALVHIAGLLTPSLSSQRLFAYQKPYTPSDIYSILKKMKPDFEWPEPSVVEAGDQSQVPGAARTEEIIKDFFGIKRFKSLEESLQETFEGLF